MMKTSERSFFILFFLGGVVGVDRWLGWKGDGDLGGRVYLWVLGRGRASC